MPTIINHKPQNPPLGGTQDAVTWFGVTNGSISVAATGTPGSLTTKIASIPITTGTVPLVSGLWAFVWLSWEAYSQPNAAKFSISKNRFFAAVQGAGSIGSYLLSPPFTGPSIQILPPINSQCELGLEGPFTLDQYVEITPHINSTTGDLEVYINCLSRQFDTWDFNKLTAEYQIVGCV